jgi:prohibitin 2
MSRIPKDQWERLQLILQSRNRFNGFRPGGGGGGGIGASAALIVLGLGGWALSNSLFNGKDAVCYFLGSGLYPVAMLKTGCS